MSDLDQKMNDQIRQFAGKRPADPPKPSDDGSNETVEEFAQRQGARSPKLVAKLISNQGIALEEAAKRLRNEHPELFKPVDHDWAMNDAIRRAAGRKL